MGRSVWEQLCTEEQVHVAFLGGSITKGILCSRPYGEVFIAELNEERKKRGKASGTHHRMGNAGCTSLWGMFCLEELLAEHPKLVVLEYSVNDYKDQKHREAYEGLVRRVLAAGALPLVLILVSQHDYSCRSHMNRIGRHYGVPIVDAGISLLQGIEAGMYTWQQYSSDYIHPNFWGHEFIFRHCKEALCAYEAIEPRTLLTDDAVFATPYEHFYTVPGGELTAKGPIQEVLFQGNEVLVSYERTKEAWAGMIEVRIDGAYVGTIDTFDFTAWGNPVVESFYAEDSLQENETDSHRLTLTYVQRQKSEKVIVYAIGSVRELQVP